MKTTISKFSSQIGLVALAVAIGNINIAEAKALTRDELLANRVTTSLSTPHISSESVAIGQTMPGPYPGGPGPYPGGPGPFPLPLPFPGGSRPYPGGPGPFPLPLPYPGGPGPFPLPLPFPF